MIRSHCRDLFDMTHDDVYTQEGKKRFTDIQGKMWENRKILGEYGAFVEKVYGPDVIPEYAMRSALKHWREGDAHVIDGYSFGSVRRQQGRVYQKHGGVIVEIIRPGIEQSGNIWDMYDQQLVNHTFANNASTLAELERDVISFFSRIL